MLTFTRAQPVEEGFRPTSTQLRLLAKAFNDRLRTFSFCSWRLCWYWYNLFRQPRNPDSSGFTFPAQGEFFHVYQHLDPEHHEGTTWPVAGPGEPEGANLANPMNQFVFGIDPGIDREDVRLNFGLPFLVTPTPTLADLWELGKAQRGTYDPATTGQNTPAWDVARGLFSVQQPWWSPHGKALGGWLPTPVQLLPDCGATESTGAGIPSYELKFTALRADVSTAGLHGTISTNADGNPVVTYAGTCACTDDNVANGHVIGYSATPDGWLLAVVTDAASCAYAIDRFPLADWIEGPYEGEGELAHTVGNQLQRALWAFDVDFRGTPGQREPDTFRIRRIAFDNQAFFTRQYALAPNIGRMDGDSLLALYPKAEWAPGNIPQGTFGQFADGTAHPYAPGFVLGGVFARATKLAARVQIGVYSNEQLIATLDLVPDEHGDASAIQWLKSATRPDPLRMKLLADAGFIGPGGSLYAEATEQVEYKPNYWDAYLVMRFGASQGGDQFGGGVDGGGRYTDTARQIGEAYFAQGCLNNYQGVRTIAEWVNDNPVFDAARRLSRDHARITRRQQLVSYEVTNGKSILRFKRFAQYPGIDGVQVRADCFAGIAPPIDPLESGKLIEGETYVVRGSGRINYRGSDYRQGEQFTAAGEASFQIDGDARVYVFDGIRHAALKKGFTNEWTLFLEPRPYHPSATSIWKPEAYSDYFAWCDRCHFYSGTAPTRLRRFAAFNNTTSLDPDTFNPTLNPISLQATMLAPELPDQFRYSAGANQTYGSPEFYKSCQVYNRPYEIESCIVDDWADDQVIKITLTTRLRSHPNAPATVNVNPLSWSAGEVQALHNGGASPEDFRTDDNAVREYVLSQASGSSPCVFRTGDAGTGSAVSSLPDNPFGACYPVFFFGRLVPEPYDDGNDVMQSHDSRCLIDSLLQMEVALRAMCEGFVDARTSQDIICKTGLGNLYDYTFENLCHDGFGGRWIGAFDLDTRGDGPGGFGPLPNTRMYAEVFNRLVACVNLLDKVRLDLPIKFKNRSITAVGYQPVTLTNLRGTTCTTTGLCAAYGDGLSAPGAGGSPTVDAWSEWTEISATKVCTPFGCPYQLQTYDQKVEYRVEVDPDFYDAVPADLLEHVNNGGTGFLAIYTTEQVTARRLVVSSPEADRCPNEPELGPFWFSDAPEYYHWAYSQTDASTCIAVSSGILEAPPLLPCDYAIGRAADMEPGVYCQVGPSSGAGLRLIAEQGAYIEIPVA